MTDEKQDEGQEPVATAGSHELTGDEHPNAKYVAEARGGLVAPPQNAVAGSPVGGTTADIGTPTVPMPTPTADEDDDAGDAEDDLEDDGDQDGGPEEGVALAWSEKDTKDELAAEAERRKLDVAGTGANGAVTKNDLVGALQADDKDRTADA